MMRFLDLLFLNSGTCPITWSGHIEFDGEFDAACFACPREGISDDVMSHVKQIRPGNQTKEAPSVRHYKGR